MTLKEFLNSGDKFAAGSGARLIEIAQDGVRIATFTGQAYTGRNPISFDALQ